VAIAAGQVEHANMRLVLSCPLPARVLFGRWCERQFPLAKHLI